ncbi:MAG: protein translocase subunit SecDF, partial [Flavobacteriaceae bacterium]|nr:protein translocase subunit SecDF [Flavobacteriaceae bacterium]
MQNKGLIRLFAILFGIVSLYQLSFTYFAGNVEDDAKAYARAKVPSNNGKDLARFEKIYLDSVGNINIINLGFSEYSYNDIRDKEMNLGLDLKGGINAILQVSVKDILIGLSNDSKNVVFNQALAAADIAQKNSSDTYLNLFFDEFERISNGNVKLSDPTIFGNKSLRDKIDFQKTNAEVKPIIQLEIDSSIDTAFEVLRSRVDKFGVAQPNIQRIGNSGRIQIELPGAKDIARVKKLLTSTAKLQFWEVFTNLEVQSYFFSANQKVTEILKAETPTEVNDTIKKDDIDNLLGGKDSTAIVNQKTLF